MTGRSLRNLEFPAETVAGYRLCERRPDLEGPHTQVYLASKADSPEIDCLIKLVDARELDPERLDEQVKAESPLDGDRRRDPGRRGGLPVRRPRNGNGGRAID
jgi:hypothetical protein